MPVLTYTERLATENCYLCGMQFAMPEEYQTRRRNDHARFFCPSGHGQVYTSKSEAEQLRDQIAAKDREIAAQRSRVEVEQRRVVDARAQRDAVQRSLSATKAVVTRTKKKIVAGRCPCCSHKFKDLATHMQTRHPAYDPDKAVAAIEAKG